jgi:hypothetical protein
VETFDNLYESEGRFEEIYRQIAERLAEIAAASGEPVVYCVPGHPAVGEASHAVVREAKAAGVWIFGGGVQRQRSSIVATDGTITDGPVPETKSVVGGFSIIEVPSREEALAWAARIAKGCRCSQEVREIMFDPES